MSDANENKIVKLVSLNIVDFKELKKGIISWNFQPNGLFGAISVTSFHEQSTLFQAFEFGFGHGTDAKDAEVIVTLHVSERNDVQTWQFKHSKETTRGRDEFGIKCGVDNDFQVVNQNEYFEKFAKDFKVPACSRAFCFGGLSKNKLAVSEMDLRSLLESYLMGEKQKYDHNEVEERIDSMGEQLNVLKKANKYTEIQKSFKEEDEKRNHRINWKCDLWLIQLFYYHTYTEHLKADIDSLTKKIDNTVDLNCHQLLQEIFEWDTEMSDSVLVLQRNSLDEIFDPSDKYSKKCKDLEEQITLYEHQLETDFNLDLQCELLDTKTEFVLEKHAQPKFRMPQFEKKSANALIGMCTIEEIPEYKLMIDRQKEANENLQRANNFSASLHQFKDNAFIVEYYLDQLSNGSFCEIKTLYVGSSNKLTSELLGNRTLVRNVKYHSKPLDPNPLGRTIQRNNKRKHFDSIHSSLHRSIGEAIVALKSLFELHKEINRIKDKQYIVIGRPNDDTEMAPTEMQILSKGEKLVELIEKFVKNKCIESIIKLEEAFRHDTALSIDHCNHKITKLGLNLPFDLKKETSPQAYFNCISELDGLDPKASITEIFKKVKKLTEAKAENICISINDDNSGKIEKMFHKKRKKIIIGLYKERQKWNNRVFGFQKRFKSDDNDRVAESSKDLNETFNKLSEICQQDGLTMELHSDDNALKSKICMSVEDKTTDSKMPNLVTTQNHQVAGLVLKMAINCVIESPFLIFDSLEYALEPHLIGIIIEVLRHLKQVNGVQVIFMLMNSLNKVPATSTHHMWTKDGNDAIADTSKYVVEKRIEDEVSAMNNGPSAEPMD